MKDKFRAKKEKRRDKKRFRIGLRGVKRKKGIQTLKTLGGTERKWNQRESTSFGYLTVNFLETKLQKPRGKGETKIQGGTRSPKPQQ